MYNRVVCVSVCWVCVWGVAESKRERERERERKEKGRRQSDRGELISVYNKGE